MRPYNSQEGNTTYRHSIPYKHKGLYLIITLPLILMYILLACYLYKVSTVHLIIYGMLFLFTVILQSYNCIYWECPHVGTFCPGAGGFCVLSSPLGKLLITLKIKRSATVYKVVCNIAFLGFLGIIFYPAYFILKISVLHLVGYFFIIHLYFAGMMLFICPACGAKSACPGGRLSSKIKKGDQHDT